MKFEMSKFKKVREDKHMATLKHPDGHEIRVAKKRLNKDMLGQLKKLPMMADGGEAPDDQVNTIMGDDQAAPQGATAPMGFKPPPAPRPGPMLMGPNLGQPTQPQAQTQPGQKPRPQIADPFDQQIKGMQQGFNQERAGIQAGADAVGAQGKLDFAAAANNQDLVLMQKQAHQKEYDKLTGEIKGAIADINSGHIDPDHYLNSKSDVGKVSSAIGLILGGIGGGLTHQQNPALVFLNNQINRDVEAQRLNLGKKESVLNAYYKQMGNLNDATKMTYAFYNELYANELTKNAALSKNQAGQAAAMQAAGQLQQKAAATIGPLSFQRSMFNMMQSDALGQMDPAAKVNIMGRMGLMNPTQQAAANKEIGNAQEVESLRRDSLGSFDHIAGQTLNGAFSPNDTESAKQAFIGKIIKQSEGRYNYEAAENLAAAIFPSKTDTHSTVLNKRARMNNLFDSMRQEPTLNGAGIHVPRAADVRPNSNTMPGYKK